MKQLLSGKIAIVTGASRGLGLEIARRYLEHGAKISICGRDAAELERAHSDLQSSPAAIDAVHRICGDVSQLDDARRIVASTHEVFGGLDILVNNAGVYGPKGTIESVDWNEWKQSIEINLFGSVLMCREVLPYFKAQRRGKIVQLSGGGATNPLPRLSAYAVAKAGAVRFVETLALEVGDSGIDVNAIAPGALNTRMLDEILAAGPENVGPAFYERSLKQKASGGTPLAAGAELAVYLGSSLSDGISGKLISAVWDPWRSLAERLELLKSTDVYTLRRIVPADRGMDWGGN